jgi:phage-related protein
VIVLALVKNTWKTPPAAPTDGPLTFVVNWIKAARRDFEDFPQGAQIEMARALTILAEGRMPDIAKHLAGFGAGVMELALRHRGDAFRVVYALRIDTDIWVIHAFQKKSKSGIKTPKQEIDLIHARLRRLKERLE